MFSFIPNNTYSRSELSPIGEIKNIHYGDILIKYGNVLDVQNSNVPYLSATINIKRIDSYLNNGDIIFADTAEDETAGKAIEIYNLKDDKVVSGLHTMPCRPQYEFASKYLGYYLNSSGYHNQLLSYIQGIKVLSISKSNIIKTFINYPSIETQTKIAKFLSLVDTRIEKQRLLVENLKKYKRGLLSQLLNQNLTINKSNKQWNVVKLSQILKERKIYCEKDGTYEHATLSKEGVSGKTERYERDFLVSDENKKYKITKKGDICYNPANLKFGVICLNTYGDAIFSPIYITFEINQNCNKEYIGYYLTRADFINRALKFQQGTVYERMAVSPEDLLSMEIALPDINEQNKIAKILCCFEDKIKNESSKFEKLKRMKSALLQQMFI